LPEAVRQKIQPYSQRGKWRSQQNGNLTENQSAALAHQPNGADRAERLISGVGSPASTDLALVRAESSDAYPVVARLNARWRVIACRHDMQWILQYRNRAETVARDIWRGRSYCRTKEALIGVCDRHAGAIDLEARATLAGLPDWFPEKQAGTGYRERFD
jgi:hypothetical protein